MEAANARGIAHRDLKPENIVLSCDSNDIMVIDWGSGAILVDKKVPLETYVTTRFYRSPEIVNRKDYTYTHDPFAADMWSAGCILVEMCTRQSLFPIPSNITTQKFKKMYMDRVPLFENDINILTGSSELFQIAKKMLRYNPLERITAKQVLPLIQNLQAKVYKDGTGKNSL
jgi:serine/threonine protein kinase